MDEKMQKFEAMATKRVTNIVHAINVLSNLSNRSSYHYTEEHVKQIFGAIEDATAKCREKFTAVKKPQTSSFSFSHTEAPAEPKPQTAPEANAPAAHANSAIPF